PDAYGHVMSGQTYRYDALTNLTSVTTTLADGTSDTATYHYANLQDSTQLTSVTHTHSGFPPSIALQYDANGRMTQDDAGRTLEYDVIGRLIAVSGAGISGGGYGYDAQNQLVSQQVSSSDTRQLYYRADERVNEELVQQNRQLRLIKAVHACLGVNDGTRLTLTGTDSNASLLWSREGGQPTGNLHAWSPYGSGDVTDLLPGFNGERVDPVSGTYHLGNGYRAYNPVLMRFNCPDSLSPFGAGGINPYAYCAGDPINYTDPSGHLSWQAITGIIAGAIGIALAAFTAGASIAAAGGVIAAINAASTTSLVVGGLAVAADVTAIASGATEVVNPEASGVLGWMSLGLGVAGLGSSTIMHFTRYSRYMARHEREMFAGLNPSEQRFYNLFREHNVPPEAAASFARNAFAEHMRGQQNPRARPRPQASGASSRAQASGASSRAQDNGASSRAQAGNRQRRIYNNVARENSEINVPSPAGESTENYSLIYRIINNSDNMNTVFPQQMSKKEFNKTLLQVHPDKVGNVEVKRHATQAFQILQQWKVRLINESVA
ncbi:RHS repeat-associated core domain-containing protein, partial [Candidatus Symbiopectobacterium sp. NZEC135]|uniref:RHS repeat-associated core domain-containing protein n=1 Tax=Candidatus Symbiopectobacterium sp. NZEC135 TaxID=2820471 RepID=UPI0022266BF4